VSAILETQSGRFIDVLKPNPNDIRILDIAHALSHQCRFGGHTKHHYSVAQHSVNVSYLVPEEHALQALLHDATEAYLVDIPTPVKNHLVGYRDIEDNLWKAIAKKYGVSEYMNESVKEADARICITEKIHLISPHGLDGPGWSGLTSRYTAYDAKEIPDAVCFDELAPEEVAEMFMARFGELMNER
jgi:5'-deoxynucleotidase YfbR-like HD superfamily hydrolase